jgi:hypothetical protein
MMLGCEALLSIPRFSWFRILCRARFLLLRLNFHRPAFRLFKRAGPGEFLFVTLPPGAFHGSPPEEPAEASMGIVWPRVFLSVRMPAKLSPSHTGHTALVSKILIAAREALSREITLKSPISRSSLIDYKPSPRKIKRKGYARACTRLIFELINRWVRNNG